MSKFLSTLFFCLMSVISFSQSTKEVTSMDIMRSNGKIYVVVTVVLVILLGLFFYVWRLDKKITAIENNKNV